MPKSVIKTRFVLLFVFQIVLVLVVAGFYLQWHLRLILERELGAKLEAIAGSVASQLDASLAMSLIPGDEHTRTYRNLRHRLLEIQAATGVSRIAVFSLSQGHIVDTDSSAIIGQFYTRQQFDREEFNKVIQGERASSVLFEGTDGRLYKTGYTPIYIGQSVEAVVAVEGSAATLKAVREVQGKLVQVGIAAIIFAVITAMFLSSQITLPLRKLQRAAERFSTGNLDQRVEIHGNDEIAFLGKTMDEMRRSILQRDERQKAMLAGVAHEIRNPLGGIELFASLLADELPDDEAKEQVSKILKEARNLKGIVQDFLDYARPIVPKKTVCSIAACLSESEILLAEELGKNGVQIEYDSPAHKTASGSAHKTAGGPGHRILGGDIQVFVDSQHLKQVFLNLIKNAIQAMPDGGTIQVEIAKENNTAIVRFSDSGTGIANESVEKIFDPFYTTKEQGLGLGLSLVKNLLEENGSSIALQSTDSSGTTFEIRLPIAMVKE